MRLIVTARAKINLDLRVLARRADGYHELRTLFQEIDLHDTVIVEQTRGPFTLAGPADRMPLDSTNLVCQAAMRLWKASGRRGEPRDVRVSIRKRIPARAGLGGGSSDAAATLVGLDRLWGARLGAPALHRLAAGLGADVAFFLLGGTALGLGRGDQLYPLLDVPVTPVVLVLPPFGVPTADAYTWLSADRAGTVPQPIEDGSESGTVPNWTDWVSVPGAVPGWRNDLEAAVEARRPEIREIRRELADHGAWLARMSGSGSAVFGLFPTSAAAARAARRLASHGWPTLVTRTHPRSLAARRRLGGPGRR